MRAVPSTERTKKRCVAMDLSALREYADLGISIAILFTIGKRLKVVEDALIRLETRVSTLLSLAPMVTSKPTVSSEEEFEQSITRPVVDIRRRMR